MLTIVETAAAPLAPDERDQRGNGVDRFQRDQNINDVPAEPFIDIELGQMTTQELEFVIPRNPACCPTRRDAPETVTQSLLALLLSARGKSWTSFSHQVPEQVHYSLH